MAKMNTKHAPVFILLTRITLAWREITRKNVVERVELKTLHPAGLLAVVFCFFIVFVFVFLLFFVACVHPINLSVSLSMLASLRACF